MTLDQLQGIIRALIAAVSGVAMAFGWLNGVDWVSITGAIIAVATAVWSFFHNGAQAKAAGK